jgi:quercetin dioxygenase-like cupin family protein
MRIHSVLTQSSFALCGLLFFVSSSPVDFAAEPAETPGPNDRVVQILQEPRHRTMHKDGDIRLLDVQINPGDMTLFHTHDAAIMYTFISSGSGPSGGRISSNTDYVQENYTHQVANDGPGLFRIIALTNYGPAMGALTSDRPDGLSGEPELENLYFRSYRITLAPGETSAPQTHHNPSVVVQVSDGLAHVTRTDGITAELTEMGDWAWREPHGSYQVKNMGSVPVELVINEARRAM